MNKEFKIETFTDMVNATNPDNVDLFLLDLKGILDSFHMLRGLHDLHGKTFVFQKHYDWKDDGNNEVTITLKPTE